MLEIIAIVLSSVSVFYAFLVWRSLHKIQVAVSRAFGEKALLMHAGKKAERFQKQLLEELLPQILSQIHPLGGLATPFIRSLMENMDLKPSDVLGIVQAIGELLSSFGKQQNLNKKSSENKILKSLFGGVNGEKEKEEKEKS